jgi:hypothetical protein
VSPSFLSDVERGFVKLPPAQVSRYKAGVLSLRETKTQSIIEVTKGGQ